MPPVRGGASWRPLLNGDHSNIEVTTDLQTFGLILTAEPYFAVTQPSDVVVMENVVSDRTRGTIQPIDTHYELCALARVPKSLSTGAAVSPLESARNSAPS